MYGLCRRKNYGFTNYFSALGMLSQIVILAASSGLSETSQFKGINDIGNLSCILSDMDGTLLQREHGVSKRNMDAITLLKSKGVPFFPATGRTRLSMAVAAGKEFVDILGGDVDKLSGVYSQGLMVFGTGGELIHERFLENEVIKNMEQYCQNNKISLIAYAGDRILTTEQTYYTRLITKYREPIPELLNLPLHKINGESLRINKLIILESEEVLAMHRPIIDSQLLGKASTTKAVPNMLEVLPFGASKGEGVRILLEHFNISHEECLAFGDGENDIEMLKLVKYGVAVDNARPELKKHAKIITLSNQDDGVAIIIEQICARFCS